MAKSSSLTLQDRSRFVRLITELSHAKPSSADYNLAERLGHFVGVSGSMNLARGLRVVPNGSELTSAVNIAQVRESALAAREHMMRTIIDSFAAGASDAKNRLPSIAAGVRAEALKTVEPYQRFYTTHQVEMAVGIRTMRDQLRAAMVRVSPELHKLAVLDKTLDDSLEAHTRKQFGVVPKVLEQRFNALRLASSPKHQTKAGSQTKPALNPEPSSNITDSAPKANEELADLAEPANADDAWLILFCNDMRELLLAEFDMRLQPVLGLLEALNEHEGMIND